jgi:hypothetical protein
MGGLATSPLFFFFFRQQPQAATQTPTAYCGFFFLTDRSVLTIQLQSTKYKVSRRCALMTKFVLAGSDTYLFPEVIGFEPPSIETLLEPTFHQSVKVHITFSRINAQQYFTRYV